MNEQVMIIAKLQAADITKSDWDWGILESIQDKYAKGYLRASSENSLTAYSSSEEGYRSDLIHAAKFDIWGQ